MVAVLGVMAMVAFVFLDPLMQYLGNDQVAAENPVVVETRYGNYKESDLAAIRDTRAMVDAFLQRAVGATIDAQVQSQQFDPRMAQQIADNMYLQWRNRLMERGVPGPEAAAVRTVVLANRARELGMVVSDQTINDLIAEITFDSISSDGLMSIISSLHQGQRVSPARLFEAIRTELLAANLSLMFQVSTVDFPPAQKFEFFSQLNRQAKAEVIPLAVSDFTSQVANASDDVLKEFFDKYKNQFPDAASPDPGFKEPPRAAFQYFKADFAKLREEMKSKVTEEEIKDYYEKNKAQFLELDLPEGPADDKPADDKSEEAPADASPSDAEPADTEPANDQPAESKPDEPPTDPAAEAPKADAPPGEEAPASTEPKESDPPNPSQGARRDRSVFQLTSASAQEEQPAAAEPAASETPPAGEAQPAETPAEPAATADQPAAAPADAPAESAAAASEPAADAAATTDQPAGPRYEPLEKVSDQIRDSIASQKAAERIGEIFDELQAEMRRHGEELLDYETRDQKDTSIKPPAPFPFAELAKKHGIDAAEVPLISATEVAAEELGKVARIVQDRRSQFGFRRETFPEFAFSTSLPTYRSMVVNDMDGNSFLFWKTKEQAALVPKFEDVREKVLAAWKMKEARPLARKRAEELAKQADTADKPLAEVFAEQKDLKVIETGAFSWLTRGNVPENPMGGPVRISEIEGLEQIGNGFMEVVFSLEAGKSGVAANQPEDTVYVVRPSEFLPEVDQLRDQFAKERPNTYMTVAQGDRYEMFTTWVDNLEKEAGVKWVRPADVRTAATESDADL